ncbi:hypothetical protein F4V43_02470 [Paenibacillus spiritus]|uniref:Uncharacterized protein n=1 Tax=Paenibacillus spiritus TaxID=2496557 RepID=A0A5J5GGT6_9BACL|nr:hypothetical protein [Paenibacillus spiritus]KAA9007371.1 hypothetical protein F4V43_02470 [Paenibacillus spiritus]
MFLNQLLEEYKETDDEKEKLQLFKEFTDRLWKSKYSFKKYKKYHTFNVSETALLHRQELIELFNKYNEIEYTVCKSFYNKRLDSIDYIRVHLNNTYGYLVDKDVYFNKEYYRLLITPKREYFKVIKALSNGEVVDCEEVEKNIVSALSEAEIVKMKSINKKISLTFSAYKKLINSYLERIFNNYKPVHEYEQEHGWEMRIVVDGWSEDNYIIKYFCRSLTGYMRDYARDQRGFKKKDKIISCEKCGSLIKKNRNVHKYCSPCAKRINILKTIENRKRNKCLK